MEYNSCKCNSKKPADEPLTCPLDICNIYLLLLKCGVQGFQPKKILKVNPSQNARNTFFSNLSYQNNNLICHNYHWWDGNFVVVVEVVEHACSATSLQLGESMPGISKDMDTHSYRVPLGVCAGITPWVNHQTTFFIQIKDYW